MVLFILYTEMGALLPVFLSFVLGELMWWKLCFRGTHHNPWNKSRGYFHRTLHHFQHPILLIKLQPCMCSSKNSWCSKLGFRPIHSNGRKLYWSVTLRLYPRNLDKSQKLNSKAGKQTPAEKTQNKDWSLSPENYPTYPGAQHPLSGPHVSECAGWRQTRRTDWQNFFTAEGN